MLQEVTLNPGCEVTAIDESTPNCGLWKAECRTNISDETARIFLMGWRVKGPEGMKIVDRR
jgi:hypothetical protein